VDRFTGTAAFVVKASLTYAADVNGDYDKGRATLDVAGTFQRDGTFKPLQFTEIFQSSDFAITFGKVTGGGHIQHKDDGSGVTFGFNAQNSDNGLKGSGVIIDRNLGIRVKILDVQAFGIAGTHAVFTGDAEVNGHVEKYRIDVDDLGEPGTDRDTFKIVTDSYSAGGVLTGGNIQIY
jgi:hypothetical protein